MTVNEPTPFLLSKSKFNPPKESPKFPVTATLSPGLAESLVKIFLV